eukprot:1190925-Prorocentrum_minimum.AAC.6
MCTRGDFSRHEELSRLSSGGSCGMNKRKVVEQPKKRSNAKARKKDTTNKRNIRDQPDANHGERKEFRGLLPGGGGQQVTPLYPPLEPPKSLWGGTPPP